MTSVLAFRIANWDTPFWVSPNRRESRFFRGTNRIVQYWALHPLTPWAEYLRGQGARDRDEVLQLRLRPWVATVEVGDDDLVELTFDTAAEHGLDPFALVDDDWAACQQWAENLEGTALIAPSAALPGTSNLVIFGPRSKVRFGVPPLDPSVEVPSDPTAESGFCVRDLLPSVRWRGDAHRGYEAWTRGDPQPMPPSVHLDRM